MSSKKTRLQLVNPKTFSNPLCSEVGYQFFYIDDEDDDTIPEHLKNKSYKTAIKVCSSCEHISDCAEWGIRKESWGVWGGLTPWDRTQIRKERGMTIRDSV